MTIRRNQSLAKKATALFSAIAASSLLGLPALAGGRTDANTAPANQTQATPSSVQAQCIPDTQSNLPATTATPDASAPGASQLPNQADPRTGLSSSGQTVTQSAGDPTASVSSGQPVTSSTDLSNNRNGAGSYGDALAQGGVTAGGLANQQVTAASNPDANRNASSSQYQVSGYGNVLSQGGATAGGFASQQVGAANNPDANRTVSSRYSSNEVRINTNNRDERGRTATVVTSGSTRADAINQSLNQSSRSMTGTTIAQCPPGAVLRSPTPEMRRSLDQPSQDTQIAPQSTDPQLRQSPADTNGSAR